ncbi:glycosyltransferase family 2 protein [Litorivivens sp.]|uniref:glycosyltransferase family 2 protein n=1 Tax=Litorivivens sp. TaxID=2020868 RepID=UPI003566D8C5
MIRFSVVIPAYNYGHLLDRAVASACEQPGNDYEVIVVDDGSTDQTPRVLKELVARYPHLNVIRQDNAGPSAARNHGVVVAGGEWVLFLDADDEMLPTALGDFRERLEISPSAEMVLAPTLSVFPDGREKLAPVPVVASSPEQRFQDYLFKRLRLSNGAVLMARSLLLRFPFNPSLRQTEDIPVFAHCLAASGEVLAVSRAVVKIHKHDGSRRHGSDAALSVGMQLVDEVFDPSRLTQSCMRYKASYRARRALSVFRILYRAGRLREARGYYREALSSDWRQALGKPGNLLKYFRALLTF